MLKAKWVPKELMTLEGMSAVVSIVAYPPNAHPDKTPLVTDCTAVIATCANGCRRIYGVDKAFIDSHLRMRVEGYNLGFEEICHWPNARP